MKVISFLNSKVGRYLRVLLGITIFSVGVWVVGGTKGTIMAVMSLMPLAGGLFDFCLFALLMGYPLKGQEIRKSLSAESTPMHGKGTPIMPYRIAAILALIIGAMAAFAGGQTLIGKVPNYTILSWLPVYNYTMGFLAVLWAAPLIWVASKYARLVAVATFATHSVVMIVIQTVFASKVAAESIEAMWIRLAFWAAILILLYVPVRVHKFVAARQSA